MFSLRRLPLPEIPWDRLDSFSDRVVFQTRAWMNFVAETQKGEPIVAEISDGNDSVGYFSGVMVRKAGFSVLGSSFPGWTTPYMGFNLAPGIPRSEVLRAFEQWAFEDLRCLHFEVSDLGFVPNDADGLDMSRTFYETYRSDLTRSEDELFGSMASACRRCIRKAEKSGVVIEEARDEAFADEYYEQLKDVFAKQGKTPTYGVERVRALVKHLLPTGSLLLLRARSSDGTCIGTGIYPGMNKVAEFWGNASWREHQQLRPNETLHWYAMRYWKHRGAQMFDWGGGGEYKEKYGVAPLRVPWFYKSRYKWVSTARDRLRSLYYNAQPLIGRLKGQRPTTASTDEKD
jgi:hypothetical protein